MYAVWFKSNRHYYVIITGIYEKKFLIDNLWKNGPLDFTYYDIKGIKENGTNDVFVPGAFVEFLHFNGINQWGYINELSLFNSSYGGIAVKNNLVVTIGYKGAQKNLCSTDY